MIVTHLEGELRAAVWFCSEQETRTKHMIKTLNPVYKQVLDLPVFIDAPTSDAWTLVMEAWDNGASLKHFLVTFWWLFDRCVSWVCAVGVFWLTASGVLFLWWQINAVRMTF